MQQIHWLYFIFLPYLDSQNEFISLEIMCKSVHFIKPICVEKKKNTLYPTPRNQFHWIAWRLILIFKAEQINFNQYIASLEYRIKNGSTVYSFEPDFLSYVNRTVRSVFLKKTGWGGWIERDEQKGSNAISGI